VTSRRPQHARFEGLRALAECLELLADEPMRTRLAAVAGHRGRIRRIVGPGPHACRNRCEPEYGFIRARQRNRWLPAVATASECGTSCRSERRRDTGTSSGYRLPINAHGMGTTFRNAR
jgi:hypothetical protein